MKALALASAILLSASLHAAPPTAATVLSGARAQAKREGKNVLVVFHASWCGWCKRFDRMLESEELKPTFDRSYVVVHLDVLENGDKKSLENPGGLDTMSSLGGKDAGLPFFAIVSPQGKKLADSLIKPGDPKTNTGHPAQPQEIAHFIDLLKATARHMNEADRQRVNAYLVTDTARR